MGLDRLSLVSVLHFPEDSVLYQDAEGVGCGSKKRSQRGERAYRALHTGPGKDVGSYSQ